MEIPDRIWFWARRLPRIAGLCRVAQHSFGEVAFDAVDTHFVVAVCRSGACAMRTGGHSRRVWETNLERYGGILELRSRWCSRICVAVAKIALRQRTVARLQVLALRRLRAFDYFLSKNPGQTTLYLRAVLAASPNYDLVDDWAPDGSLLRRYFEVAQSWPTVPYRAIPKPTDGTIYIDGQKSHQVPQDRPYVFQYFPDEGDASFSGIVEPGIAAPSDYPSAIGDIGHLRIPLLAASGATALTSGALYLLAVRAENRLGFCDAQ